jgi:hypothetical protein
MHSAVRVLSLSLQYIKDNSATNLIGPTINANQALNAQLTSCLYQCHSTIVRLESEYNERIVSVLRPAIAVRTFSFSPPNPIESRLEAFFPLPSPLLPRSNTEADDYPSSPFPFFFPSLHLSLFLLFPRPIFIPCSKPSQS